MDKKGACERGKLNMILALRGLEKAGGWRRGYCMTIITAIEKPGGPDYSGRGVEGVLMGDYNSSANTLESLRHRMCLTSRSKDILPVYFIC